MFYLLNIFHIKLDEDIKTVFIFYPFAIFLSPILGLFWVNFKSNLIYYTILNLLFCIWKISSSSYKIGKYFLVYNYMSGANILLNIMLLLWNTEAKGRTSINLCLKGADFLLKCALAFVGGVYLSHVRKRIN